MLNDTQITKLIEVGAKAGEVFVLAIMIIYTASSFILTRRIKVMNLNLKTPHSKNFTRISKIHTILLLLVILLTLLSIGL